ncbi:MAG TPA: hypothetical protein VGA53_00970 [Candidatus Paceibacterota bacterium]
MRILRFLWKYKIGATIGLLYSGSILFIYAYLRDICDIFQVGICTEGWGWTFALLGIPVYFPLIIVSGVLPFLPWFLLLTLTLLSFVVFGAILEFLFRKFFRRKKVTA